jgi:hypothetical protein
LLSYHDEAVVAVDVIVLDSDLNKVLWPSHEVEATCVQPAIRSDVTKSCAKGTLLREMYAHNFVTDSDLNKVLWPSHEVEATRVQTTIRSDVTKSCVKGTLLREM